MIGTYNIDTHNKNISVFLSYRNHDPGKSEAEKLYEVLTKEGFEVFYDQKGLRGGEMWAERIYSEVRISDVLIVLLQTGEKAEDGLSTAESEWVQREIDVARGANVEILPLNLYLDDMVNLAEVQRLLAIDARQFQKYTSTQSI